MQNVNIIIIIAHAQQMIQIDIYYLTNFSDNCFSLPLQECKLMLWPIIARRTCSSGTSLSPRDAG